MKTSVAPGRAVSLAVPVGGVVGGESYTIGALHVVADETVAYASGARFSGIPEGVFMVRKPEEVWTAGAKVYFDKDFSPDPIYTVDAGSPALPLVGVTTRAIPLSLIVASDDSDSPPALTISVDGAVATITVDDFEALAGDALTVTINGVEHVLTEGMEYTAETSNAITAANLGAALAGLYGASAVVDDDAITLTVLHPSTVGYVRLDGVAR